MLKNRKGFTLVELLAVIVILAIILAIAIPSISGIVTSAKKSAFENDVKMIITGIEYQVLQASIGEGTSPDVDADILNELSTYGANSSDYTAAAITLLEPITVSITSSTNSEFGAWTVTGATKASVIVTTP